MFGYLGAAVRPWLTFDSRHDTGRSGGKATLGRINESRGDSMCYAIPWGRRPCSAIDMCFAPRVVMTCAVIVTQFYSVI